MLIDFLKYGVIYIKGVPYPVLYIYFKIYVVESGVNLAFVLINLVGFVIVYLFLVTSNYLEKNALILCYIVAF